MKMKRSNKNIKSEFEFEPLKFSNLPSSSFAKTSKQKPIDITHDDLCHAIQIANKFLENRLVGTILKELIEDNESEDQIMVVFYKCLVILFRNYFFNILNNVFYLTYSNLA